MWITFFQKTLKNQEKLAFWEKLPKKLSTFYPQFWVDFGAKNKECENFRKMWITMWIKCG